MDTFTSKRKVVKDGKTGREYWQLTEGAFDCQAPYFVRPAWSKDESYIVMMCNRTGSWQPYRYTIETGEAIQLASVKDAGFMSVSVNTHSNEAICYDNNGYTGIHLETLKIRKVVEFDETLYKSDKAGRHASLSGDGTLLVVPQTRDQAPHEIWIAKTDGSNEVSKHILEKKFVLPWHEQFCPTDNNVISFNDCNTKTRVMDASFEERVRDWRMDLTTGKMTPLANTPPPHSATHCSWGKSGKRFYFHRKTLKWVPTALCSVDKDGQDFKVHYETSDYWLGHSYTDPREEWIVTDSQEPDENILMLAHLHRDEQHLLCWPNNSMNNTWLENSNKDLPELNHRHTHPGFSPSGKYIQFNSDQSGQSHVYIMPIDDLVNTI